MSQKLKKIGVLISGRGSNLAAIIQAINEKKLQAEIPLVISNNPVAKGLEIANEAGIASLAIDPKAYITTQRYEAAICMQLKEAKVDYIVLAGYMKLLGDTMFQMFKGKILNIHPSLLPKFKGLKAQRQALEAKEKESGCTVHFVTPEMDAGPIIAQASVPIKEGDNEQRLSERILSVEHQLYPKAIAEVIEGKFENIVKKLQNIKY
ncbi:MAG: phosphoribosylglycinamide formyltransferase [bacterium]